MIFDALVLSQIRRAPAFAAIVVCAIALGVGAILALDLASARADRAVRVTVDALDDRATFHVVATGGGRIDERTLAVVRDTPGVRDARPVLDGFAASRDGRGGGRTLHVVGIDMLAAFPGSSTLRAYDAGPFAPPGRLDRALVAGGAVLSQRLGGELAVAEGATLVLRAAGGSFAVPVAAIVRRPVPGVDPSLALVDVSTAQRLFAAGATLDRIDVVADGASAATLRARLPRNVRVVATADRVAALERATAGFAVDLRSLAFATLFVAAALVANAVAISVRRRRADIATVRVLGATRARIFGAFVGEGVVYGALGATCGTVAGDALAGALAPDWSAAGDLPFCARDLALGIVFATVASVVPAWRAASVVPAIGLRASAPRVPRAAARFVARVRTPFPVRLALIASAATASQASIALVALVLATAVGTGASIAAASFATAVAAWSARAMPGDLALRPLPFARATISERLRERVARVPGVARVGTSRRIDVVVRAAPASLLALDADAFVARGGVPRATALVTTALAARDGLRSGEDLVLTGPRGRATLRVAKLADDYGSAIGTIAIDANTYARLYGDATADELFVSVAPHASVARVRDALARVAARESVDVRPLGTMRADVVASFARAFSLGAALGAVAIVVAIAGAVLTFVALVTERREAYAMLRTLGLSRAGLRVAIVVEAATFAATGAALGSFVGLGVGASLVRVANAASGWSTVPQVPLGSMFGTALAIVAATAFAALAPARVATRAPGATR